MYSKPWFVIMHTRPHTVMNIYIIEDKKIHVTISMSLDISISGCMVLYRGIWNQGANGVTGILYWSLN